MTNRRRHILHNVVLPIAIAAVAVLLIVGPRLFFRIDLTDQNRYSLADGTRQLLHQVDRPLHATLYLTGDLDANLLRLSHATADMIAEMNNYTNPRISFATVDPNDADSDEQRYQLYTSLENRGMKGMNVSLRQDGGRLSEQIIFPWMEIASPTDTIRICLMQPSGKLSGEQAVNAAIEDLEYQCSDAIRLLTSTTAKRIAFIEGHGEIDEEYVYDATEALSRYFNVDRGTIGSDASVLNAYAAIIIAGPQQPLSETDKYIIDQYIMQGGRVLWLVDGTKNSSDLLAKDGSTPIIGNDINISDMLFRYGVRVTPSVIEDMQCAYIPVNIARPGDEPQFEPIPWFFTPLLQSSPYHPVTKTVGTVRANFASGIEIVGDTTAISKTLLLASSNSSHVTFAPNAINVSDAISVEPQQYFNSAFIPVAIALEGRFTSIYNHRMPPAGVQNPTSYSHSADTKMIVVADADIIRNDIEQHREGLMVVPLGLDRLTQNTYGNRQFIVNSLLYLTDDQGVMQLRNKRLDLRLLNRATITAHRTSIITAATAIPLAIIALLAAIYLLVRRHTFRL